MTVFPISHPTSSRIRFSSRFATSAPRISPRSFSMARGSNRYSSHMVSIDSRSQAMLEEKRSSRPSTMPPNQTHPWTWVTWGTARSRSPYDSGRKNVSEVACRVTRRREPPARLSPISPEET